MIDTWTDRLSEYLDDELPPSERIALEAHLRSCRDCSTTLDELRDVVSRAASLPAPPPPPPPADLGPAVEPRVLPQERGSSITPFRARISRRISFTLPQLAAAGIALMVMSGGGVWMLQHGGRATSMPPVAATDPAHNPVVLPVAVTDPRYDEAIADLQQAL